MSWKGIRETSPFNVELSKPDKLDPEWMVQFWHPNRFGVKLAPDDFRRKLHDIHPDLEVTWHPLMCRWLVWYKRHRITHPLCPGWLLLFIVQNEREEFVPLDERTFAAIFEVSAFRNGNSVQYWNRLQSEMTRDKERREAAYNNHIRDFGGERYDWGLIKNIGQGNKFSNYHS